MRAAEWEATVEGTIFGLANCITPYWDIPMLGETPTVYPLPPVGVSELERPRCNCPALGPFLWQRQTRRLGRVSLWPIFRLGSPALNYAKNWKIH